MLQIITGKFFKSKDWHISEGKGVLYSNYRWYLPLETCVGRLEPLGTRASLTTYLFSFKNQIEKQNGKFSIVRAGDGEIIEQFRLLCSFALRATFAEDRSWVAHLCRSGTIGQSDQHAPSQLLARYFAPRIEGTSEDAPMFSDLVRKVLSLNRTDYLSIISVLQAFSGALEVVGSSLDLAYSMLVYGLESLAQKYTEYEPQWPDFDERTRTKLDLLLASVAANTAEGIRTALVGHSHLKLRARFQEFIYDHVDDSFFTSEAAERSFPLQKSELRRVTRNIYDVRSAYVHELAPLLQQLHEPQIAQGDVFRWDDEPHLTFNGLVRLTEHVIRNLIRRLPSIEKEEFDWFNSLPGIVRLKVAPQYWIHQVAGLHAATAHEYLTGFLSHFGEAIARGEPICEMSAVMEKIEQITGEGKPEQRRSMLALYYAYNACVGSRRPNWEQFLENYKAIVDQPCIEIMAARVMLDGGFPWTAEEGETALKLHDQTRFHRGVFHLPAVIEIALTAAVANKALREGDIERHRSLLREAVLNSAGRPEIQTALEDALKNTHQVDLALALPRRSKQPSESTVSE